MADLWLPGAERIPGQQPGGYARRPDAPPRMVLHTSETNWPAIDSLVANVQWHYHGYIDPWERRIVQCIPLNKTSYALAAYYDSGPQKGQFVGFETNHMGSYCVQWCIIGWAKDMHRLTKEQLVWMADSVFKPTMDLTGIPNQWVENRAQGEEGVVLATPSSKFRMTPAQWEKFTGVCAHQHVPGQSHWDCGDLDEKSLYARIKAQTATGGFQMPDLGGDPVGWVESCTRVGNGDVIITGWAKDPNTANAIGVHVWSGKPGEPNAEFLTGVSAALPREPEVGGPHGFHIRLENQPPERTYRVYGLNYEGTPGRNVELSGSPKKAEPAPTEPTGPTATEQALVHLEHAKAAIIAAEELLRG